VKWRGWRLASYLAAAALLWSVAAGLLLYFLPLGSSTTISSSGEEVTTSVRIFTLSLSSLWPLVLPALLCALATWCASRHYRWLLIAATVMMAVFAFISGLFIGVTYVPAVLLLIFSVSTSAPIRQTPGSGSHAGAEGMTPPCPKRINLTRRSAGGLTGSRRARRSCAVR